MLKDAYPDALFAVFRRILERESAKISEAAVWCTDAIEQDGILHLFGTGHSASLVAEGFYRAGGLACINAILETPFAIGTSTGFSAWAEQQRGWGAWVLDRYDLRAGEPIIVFSNAGMNPLPQEVAQEARRRGLRVIAVTCRTYADRLNETRREASALRSYADLIIDNHGAVGDAAVEIAPEVPPLGPTSTAAGAFILHLLVERIARLLHDRGQPVPILLSAHLPGAEEHNARLLAKYRTRLRNL